MNIYNNFYQFICAQKFLLSHVKSNLDSLKPLIHLRNIDLFFNPKLFQPSLGSCVPPIAVSFNFFRTTTTLRTLGKLSLVLQIFCDKVPLSDIAKNSLTVIPTTTLALVSSSLRVLNLADNYLNFLGSTGSNQAGFS